MRYKHEILHYLYGSIREKNKEQIRKADKNDNFWYELFFFDADKNRETLEKTSTYEQAFDTIIKYAEEYRFDRLHLAIFSGEGNGEDVVELLIPEEIYDSILRLYELNELRFVQIGKVKNPLSDNPEHEKEYAENGMIFKDEIAFEYFCDRICYVAELEEDEAEVLGNDTVGSSYSDFLEICEGNKKFAHELFKEVDWQHPSTLCNDWDLHGRLDEIRAIEAMQKNETRSPANYVSSFFYYMWNAWCENECEAAFGHSYSHFWNKWCGITTKNGVRGAAELFYAELSENHREQLVNRACEIYDRGKRIQ